LQNRIHESAPAYDRGSSTFSPMTFRIIPALTGSRRATRRTVASQSGSMGDGTSHRSFQKLAVIRRSPARARSAAYDPERSLPSIRNKCRFLKNGTREENPGIRERGDMRRFAVFGLCGLLALILPLVAWAQSKPASEPASKPAATLGEQVEQRLQKLRDPQKPRNTPDPNTLTPSEMQALIKRFADCWDVPVEVRNVPNLHVTVEVKLAKDGSLAEPPKVLNSNPDPHFAVAAKSAIAGLTRCAPFSFLPAAKYAAWQDITVDFNARELFGDKPR
jgi:hypothetical protein